MCETMPEFPVFLKHTEMCACWNPLDLEMGVTDWEYPVGQSSSMGQIQLALSIQSQAVATGKDIIFSKVLTVDL